MRALRHLLPRLSVAFALLAGGAAAHAFDIFLHEDEHSRYTLSHTYFDATREGRAGQEFLLVIHQNNPLPVPEAAQLLAPASPGTAPMFSAVAVRFFTQCNAPARLDVTESHLLDGGWDKIAVVPIKPGERLPSATGTLGELVFTKACELVVETEKRRKADEAR